MEKKFYKLYPTLLHIPFSGLFQKIIPWGWGWGEEEQGIYFSIGGWCEKISNYMGHWCPTKSTYMGGWYFAAWKGKKEYYLPKKREVLSKLAKRFALSLANRGNGHFCLHAIVKPRMFPSNIGKKWYRNKLPNSGFCSGHYFTWETCIFRRIYSRKQRYRVVRPLVKANTCKNLYQ